MGEVYDQYSENLTFPMHFFNNSTLPTYQFKFLKKNCQIQVPRKNQLGLNSSQFQSDRLVTSRFSECAVINGKDLVSLRCIKGRKEEKRDFSLLPKRLSARQIAFPYNFFARINISGDWVRVYQSDKPLNFPQFGI